MKLIVCLILILSSLPIYARDTTDVSRLKNLSYMNYSYNINCDSTTGSNLEERICLNLKFQRVDSLMNDLFDELLNMTSEDYTRQRLIKEHAKWIEERRQQSKLDSDEFRGHVFGIIYLKSMIEATVSRIKVIEELLNK